MFCATLSAETHTVLYESLWIWYVSWFVFSPFGIPWSLLIYCMHAGIESWSNRPKTGLSGGVIPAVWYCVFCTRAHMSTVHCAVPGCNEDERWHKELSFLILPKFRRWEENGLAKFEKLLAFTWRWGYMVGNTITLPEVLTVVSREKHYCFAMHRWSCNRGFHLI